MPASDQKRRLTAFVVAMAVLIATPLAVVATDAFTDVPESSVHHDNIAWLKDAGVTSGCNPPANDRYCPTDNVTRAQMATFMRNLAENQVVDAGALEGNTSDAFVQKGEADSVTASMTTSEPGVAQTIVAGSISLSGANSTLVTVDIQAPADGWAIVHMDTDVATSHTNGTASISQIGISAIADALGTDEDKTLQIPAPSPSATYNNPISMTKVYPVTAGTNTFYLVGRQQSGTASVFDTHLSAMFVASSYGTIDLATADQDDGGNETG